MNKIHQIPAAASMRNDAALSGQPVSSLFLLSSLKVVHVCSSSPSPACELHLCQPQSRRAIMSSLTCKQLSTFLLCQTHPISPHQYKLTNAAQLRCLFSLSFMPPRGCAWLSPWQWRFLEPQQQLRPARKLARCRGAARSRLQRWRQRAGWCEPAPQSAPPG